MTTVKKVEEKPATGLSLEEIKQLIAFVDESSLAEVELEIGTTKLKLTSRHGVPAAQPTYVSAPQMMAAPQMVPQAAPATPAAAPAAPAAPAPPDDSHYKKVTSPMVGTFYRSPSPSAPLFAKIGDQVSPDSVLCIIEAMKLMNEIKAEVSGKVVKIYVENGQPVEYGQPIFAIDPT